MRMAIVFWGLAVIVAHTTPSTADTANHPRHLAWRVPGEVGSVGEEKAKTATQPDGTTVITSLTNVSKPTLTVCRPEAGEKYGSGRAGLPRRRLHYLSWDHEGEQVARWLNSIGVTAAVLKYRVPRREGTPKETPPIQALMDAQRAISLVRSKAADWGVDPNGSACWDSRPAATWPPGQRPISTGGHMSGSMRRIRRLAGRTSPW